MVQVQVSTLFIRIISFGGMNMAGVAISMVADNSKSIEELAAILKREIDGELVYDSPRRLDSAVAWLLSFERFYFRNGSYATLTIMLTERENHKTADIIGSGGGEGLFNISMGANASFASMAVDLLQQCGFKEVN